MVLIYYCILNTHTHTHIPIDTLSFPPSHMQIHTNTNWKSVFTLKQKSRLHIFSLITQRRLLTTHIIKLLNITFKYDTN